MVAPDKVVPLVLLDAPNGHEIWVNPIAVTTVRPALEREFTDNVRTVIMAGGERFGVTNSVEDVVAALNGEN
jgi:uncharacterized protein YlzI (FlbEa/FlbD family)